ncbi:hypothetical protein HS088_TW04G00542 [Tripterygium wilfordii]|uniref:tRNA(Ile)-lysidine synthetase n=1 Tax=Tripterygium wilfordii TaxID=458696 RepID=A0A7J7DQY9_TRIWF|nr:uncharacterized protein LOC119997085 [Tripterygium wilfordii]KAF5748584.1 hypothetical protein HS088_TW04G00542 [Tripterygium wilfordii]
MALGGVINCSKARTSASATVTSAMLSTSILPRFSYSSLKCKTKFVYFHRHGIRVPLSTRFFCKCFNDQDPDDITSYRQAFSRRMAMAGLKPHHRIALGVSGGPDSMALCVLAAGWKTEDPDAFGKANGFIDGLLAIIVDHGLRGESKAEANLVSSRVSDMGIRSEIARCEWSDGRPNQGHLQEAARDMRYQIFQTVCTQQQIGVLLVAHHADDQAELFILRLSRNSGVLGLAGMAFTSQMFLSTHPYGKNARNYGILLVRPLLDFSKEDMYKICQGSNQSWVEDPTNKSPLYARNRIRMSLENLSSRTFKSEMQAVISACRKTRAYVHQICCDLINQAVTITDQGYAVIDLSILYPLKIKDIYLSQFVALVLQFISQRHRPIRGGASKLLLDYIRTFPCKTSLTVAGCYLCPAPGSKGAKFLACCSTNPLPLQMEVFDSPSHEEEKQYISSELKQILLDGKAYSDNLVPDASDVHFLDITSQSVLTEAKRLNIISEPTYQSVLLLQKEEMGHFKSKTEVTVDCDSKDEIKCVDTSSSVRLQPGQTCYFMNRFFVTWELKNNGFGSGHSRECYRDGDFTEETQQCNCLSCVFDSEMGAEVRHMIESDWLFLAKLSQSLSLQHAQQESILSDSKTDQIMQKSNPCLDYARSLAQRALWLLKSIPVAARRSLPVLVNSQGLLLSIPSIGFQQCPSVIVSASFKPRVPLGGGRSSFI